MYKKYTIPLSIFIVFENINTTIWTSENFNNNYFIHISNLWFYSINIFLKNDVFFSNTTLLENSAVDNNFSFFDNKYQIFLKNKILLFYVYYFYFFKNKIIFFTTYNKITKFKSVDKLFKSAGWLERETGEMFKISYSNKIDTRRLLLDYSKQENPLLKDFPVEGFNDLYYSFFDDQVIYNFTSNVEL